MADRVLTWFIRDTSDLSWLPRYYMDAEYEKVALRVYATKAPITDDLRVDIQADGVSIFQNQSSTTFTTAGQRTTTPTTTGVLVKGDNAEVDAEDFNGDSIPLGSWVTLSIPDMAGARGVSIHLELERVGEANESE